MEVGKDFNELLKEAKDYVETRLELTRLQSIEKAGRLSGFIVTSVFLLLVVSIIIIFASIGLAFLLSEKSGQGQTGFFLVAGGYSVLFIIVFIFRRALIENPITNLFIRKTLNNDEEED